MWQKSFDRVIFRSWSTFGITAAEKSSPQCPDISDGGWQNAGTSQAEDPVKDGDDGEVEQNVRMKELEAAGEPYLKQEAGDDRLNNEGGALSYMLEASWWDSWWQPHTVTEEMWAQERDEKRRKLQSI